MTGTGPTNHFDAGFPLPSAKVRLLASVSLVWFGVTVQGSAQRAQSLLHFESYAESPRVEEIDLGFVGDGRQTGARPSRGHSAFVGALIGAAVGVLGGAIAYSFCEHDDRADQGSCLGKAGLVFGFNTASGAFIGFLLGGD